MNTGRLLLFGTLGITAILLLTSDRAHDMRKDLEDKARDNAEKWKDKLNVLSNTAGKRLTELRRLLDTEVTGLSDDARARIQNILNGATNGARKMKADLA